MVKAFLRLSPAERREYVKALVERLNEKVYRTLGYWRPLRFVDAGWRITFSKALEYRIYQSHYEGRRLMQLAVADMDFEGIYYWIPIDLDAKPRGVMTPALRMALLGDDDE